MNKKDNYSFKFGLIFAVIVAVDVWMYFTFDSAKVIAVGMALALFVGFVIVYFWILRPMENVHRELEKLNQENKRIENMRKEFVANVSHEIKTPLTSIAGFIETLQSGDVRDQDVQDRFIDIIGIETDRLKRLLEDVLVLSDIESDIQPRSDDVSVNACINSVIDMMKPIAEQKNIQLHFFSNQDVVLKGDRDKLKQMLLNLVENAIKYGKQDGNVWITVKETADFQTISVMDDGIGIHAKDLDRITERFYRADKSRSKQIEGTGLGLSIVKHTASLFGGYIEVESVEGEGSTFSFIIDKRDNKE